MITRRHVHSGLGWWTLLMIAAGLLALVAMTVPLDGGAI